MCVGLDVFFWVLIINSYQNYIFGGGGMGDKSMFLGFLHIHWWKGGEGRLNNCLLLYIPLFSNKNDNIHKTKCKNETYLKNVIKNISNYRVALLLKRYSLPAGSRKWKWEATLSVRTPSYGTFTRNLSDGQADISNCKVASLLKTA